MHEYSLVQSLVTRVEQEARRRNALAIHRLSVRVGELAGVDPRQLADAHRQPVHGERAAGAGLLLDPRDEALHQRVLVH